MSSPEPRHNPGDENLPPDGVEALVKVMPIVLPVMGGLLMFLLAFIAIYVG